MPNSLLRVPTRLAVAVALAVVAPTAAMPAEGPCKLPPPGFAAEGVCEWWLNHRQAVVDNSMCCLHLQLKAADHNFDYNCHYYTRMYIHTAVPGSPYPERDGLSDLACLRQNELFGFSREPGRVYVGDIVLTKEPDAIPGCKWSHSGIVTAVNPDGTPATIRQKDGPNTCVADLSYEDFT